MMSALVCLAALVFQALSISIWLASSGKDPASFLAGVITVFAAVNVCVIIGYLYAPDH
jgi:hypothetical protein